MVTIREAKQTDAPRLAEIIRLSPEAGIWSESDLRKSIADRTSRKCLVAQREQLLVGVLAASLPAAGEAEILTLAVDPGFRRQGVATGLLRVFLQSAPGRVFLEVRRSNLAAQKLYERFGFVIAGVRVGYYPSPPEDAIVMQLMCRQ